MKARIASRHMRDAVVALGLVLGAAACTWQGVKPDAAATTKLYVQGRAPHVSDRELARLARPYLGASFMQIDTKSLRERLAAVPWLDHVNVSRRWPNGVLVRLSEHQPAARWNDAHLLDDDGAIFTPANVADVKTPVVLHGPPSSNWRVYHMYRRLQSIAAGHDVHIQALVLAAGGQWRAQLADGLTLRLGRTGLAPRLRRFVKYRNASQTARQAIASAGYIDLRYSDGFAVGGTRTAGESTSQEHS